MWVCCLLFCWGMAKSFILLCFRHIQVVSFEMGWSWKRSLQLKFFFVDCESCGLVIWSSCLTICSSPPMPRGSQCRSFQALCCQFKGCPKTFWSKSGCTNHVCSIHPKAKSKLYQTLFKSCHHQLSHYPSCLMTILSWKGLQGKQLDVQTPLAQNQVKQHSNKKYIILFLMASHFLALLTMLSFTYFIFL